MTFQALSPSQTFIPDITAIRTDLETTQSAYQKLVQSIPTPDLDRPLVISKWTVRQVLTHLCIALEQANPMMVNQARKRQPMPAFLNSRVGHWMNYQMAVWQARKATPQSLAERYAAANVKFLQLLAGVQGEEWQLNTAMPDGTPLTMEQVFYVPGQHLALHGSWIKQTLGGNGGSEQ